MVKLVKKQFSFLLVFMLLITGLFVGNGTLKTASAAAKPALNLKTVSIQRGKSRTLKLLNARGKITWKSSNQAVASVNSKGKVTAKKAGTATITATNARKNYKCTVTVAAKNTKTLIVYYSWGGETKKAAAKIAKAVNADTVRIQPKTAYSKDYDTVVKVAQRELNRNARPAIATKIASISQYDTVFVGYPIWWGDAPMLIRTFLENHNVSGKTVIPFCTSAGSGISGSMSSIRSSAKGAEVVNGRDLTDDSQTQVRNWINRVMAGSSQNTEAPSSGNTGTNDSDTGNNSNTSDTTTGNNSNTSDTNTGNNTENNTGSDANTGNNTNPGNPGNTGSGTGNNGKLLIAYFSWSGTSEKQAQAVAAQTGGELYRIERQTPYSSDYNTVAYGEAKDEADTNARPPLLNPLPSLDDYAKVVLCYPIWWHTAPMTVGTFLESYDWSGKTIYPISQSASMNASQFEESLTFVRGCAKNAVVDNGLFTKSESAITEYISNTVLK